MTQQHLIAQAEILLQDYLIARGRYEQRRTYADRLQMVRLRLTLRQWRWHLFEGVLP